MQVRQVQDSLDVTRKINLNDDFELVCMRWRYLLKSPNPDPVRMLEFKNTVTSTVRKVWRKFQYAYERTGHHLDDVKSFAQIHLVSYLGLFSLIEHQDKLQEFIRDFEANNGRPPEPEEIAKKEQANCACFLYQRLSEVAELCSKRSRNIRGSNTLKASFVITEEVFSSVESILEDPDSLGLTRLTKKKAVDMEKRAIGKPRFHRAYQSRYEVDGKQILTIDRPGQDLTVDDVTDLFYNSENSMFAMNPLEVLESMSATIKDRKYKNDFENTPPETKKRILARFIVDHEEDPKYLVEVKTAKKILNRLL